MIKSGISILFKRTPITPPPPPPHTHTHTPKERRRKKKHKTQKNTRSRKQCMEAHWCHHKVSSFHYNVKYQKMFPKRNEILLKLIPECTKSHRLFKIFRGWGGGHAPGPPYDAFAPTALTFAPSALNFCRHQPRIDDYVSEG